MSDADRLARVNGSLLAQAQGYGEPVTLLTARGALSIGAIIDVQPRDIAGIADSWERVPTAWLRASDLTAAPSQGDTIITAAGIRWIIDTLDETRGLYQCVLRAEPRL